MPTIDTLALWNSSVGAAHYAAGTQQASPAMLAGLDAARRANGRQLEFLAKLYPAEKPCDYCGTKAGRSEKGRCRECGAA